MNINPMNFVFNLKYMLFGMLTIRHYRYNNNAFEQIFARQRINKKFNPTVYTVGYFNAFL